MALYRTALASCIALHGKPAPRPAVPWQRVAALATNPDSKKPTALAEAKMAELTALQVKGPSGLRFLRRSLQGSVRARGYPQPG